MRCLSLTRPLTRKSLGDIRLLLQRSRQTPAPYPGTYLPSEHAGVLIPLCNVNNVPGILFEVRGKTLRNHSGEVSFPGGRVDPMDKTIMDAATRESAEELGIKAHQIEMLGAIGPSEINLRGGMRVWPYVAAIHESGISDNLSEDDPLPSIDLLSMRYTISLPEVDQVFHLPLARVMDPQYIRRRLFRGESPYWTICVQDLTSLVQGSNQVLDPLIDEAGEASEGKLEIWGLTGWYLNLLLRTLQVYHE